MQKNSKTVVFLTLLVLGAGALWGVMQLRQNDDAHSGGVPEFSLEDASGKTHRLNDAQGKWKLIHFWASWCPPCLTEVPELVEFARGNLQSRDVPVFAIALDDSWDKIRRFLPKEAGAQPLMLLDPTKSLAEKYGTYQLPETYLVSPQGQIVYKWVGPQKWQTPEVQKVLDHWIVNSRAGAGSGT